MTIAAVALVAAVAALALLGGMAYRARLGRRDLDDRVADALAIMGERMDALARELRTSLERVAANSERAEAVVELGSLVALDEILARAVEAAATLTGVDAAMARAEGPDGSAFVVAWGIPTELAERQVFPDAPTTDSLRAVHLAYRYHGLDDPTGSITEGLAVPLSYAGERIGFLAIYARASALADSSIQRGLETIAAAAGPAVERAHAHHDAVRASTEVDSLTGLGNRSAFFGRLAHETARAHRYGHELSLLVLDIDDFGALNRDIGQFAADEVLRAVADHVGREVEATDAAYRIGGDELAVILPDAPRLEAERLFARVQATLLREPPGAAPSVTLSGGIGVLGSAEDGISLYGQAEAALRRAKVAGKGTAA